MATYREDQGRLARMAAFWTLILLLLFGCTFLYDLLLRFESLRAAVAGHLPVVGIDLSPAFLICFAIFSIGAFVINRWQNRAKVADLLIETEAELKKVTWPTIDEVVSTSTVVVVFVLVLGAYLALTDLVFGRLAKVFIY